MGAGLGEAAAAFKPLARVVCQQVRRSGALSFSLNKFDHRVTPVFRTFVEEDGFMITRIEKLAKHLGSTQGPHPAEYIESVRRYADLVLGKDWPLNMA